MATKKKGRKIDPEAVALALSGRLHILSEKEMEDKYQVGGDIPQHAEFTIKIPDGWELSRPWEITDINDDGTIVLLLRRKP
jgi:hypothetical protein